MNEIFGAIFGYNYRRRILINLRKKRKLLREKNILKLKQKREKEKLKKEKEIIRRSKEKQEKELEQEQEIEQEVEQDIKEEVISEEKPLEVKEIVSLKEKEPKEEIVEVQEPKDDRLDLSAIEEDLNITKEKLVLIEKLDEKYNLPEDNMRDLIEEVMISLDIIKVLKEKKELTEEDKEIAKDIRDDSLLEEIIEEDKKEIVICVNDRTSSMEEVNDDFDKYKVEFDYYLKKSKEQIDEISDAINNKELDIEVRRRTLQTGIRTHTMLLLAANISARRNPAMLMVTRRLLFRSLIFDRLVPRRRTVINRSEILPEKDLEAARRDIDYARLSILDYKKDLDNFFYDLEYYKDKEEYKESYEEIYKELETLFFELKKEEKELDELENELVDSEEYIPEEEEEIYDNDGLGLYYLLRPRPRDIVRTLLMTNNGHLPNNNGHP